MKNKILVIEDDKNTNLSICEFLKDVGFETCAVSDGSLAMKIFEADSFCLVILDIMLPGVDGITILKNIRAKSNIPIIMLTAMTDEYTQLISFDKLADDYVTKPFSVAVLVKRVKSLLRRSFADTLDVYYIEDIAINFSSYTVESNSGKIDLTKKEFELLKYMIENKNRVLSRQQILDGAWGVEYIVGDRTVDTHIKNIRKKLSTDRLVTIKNVGYKFEEII
jgi:DNA-binding response OmpR family regulator